MGFFDFLFGKEEKSKTTSQVVQTPTLAPQQQDVLSWLTSAMQYNQPTAGQFGTIPELTYTNANPIMFQNALRAALQTPINALDAAILNTPQEFNQFLDDLIAKQQEEYRDVTLPTLRAGYAPSGFYSGERLQAETDLTRQHEIDMGRLRSETAIKAREQQGSLATLLAALTGEIPKFDFETFMGLAKQKEVERQARLDSMLRILGAEAQQPMVLQTTTSSGGQPGILGGVLGKVIGGTLGKIFG